MLNTSDKPVLRGVQARLLKLPNGERKLHRYYRSELKRCSPIYSRVEVLGHYTGTKTKVPHRCLECNMVWDTCPEYLFAGQGCWNCYKTKRAGQTLKYSHADYLAIVEPRGFKVLDQYQGSYVDLRHICPKGHEFLGSPNSLGSGRGCPTCGDINRRTKMRKTHDTYLSELEECGSGVVPLEPYQNATTKILHRCRCEREWMIAPDTARTGVRCGVCTGSGYKSYQLGDRMVNVRGFEPQALDWILANTGIQADEIVVDSEGRVPVIHYGRHRFLPDLWIPDRNILVEVKGNATMGLCLEPWFGMTAADLFRVNCRKMRAALRAGYDMRWLLMYGTGQRRALPEGWFNMQHDEFVLALRSIE